VIAVDTSALMAIVRGEPEADLCQTVLMQQETLLIAAPTITEALIVARGRGVESEMRELLDELAPTIVPLTGQRAREAAHAHERWGKGNHPAALNFGDCFAYALATEHACPLLFVGHDFAQTDIVAARA
jgi:ribonuclease VapC